LMENKLGSILLRRHEFEKRLRGAWPWLGRSICYYYSF
jgi:hypothetical protein